MSHPTSEGEHHMHRSLSWREGFAFALIVPIGLFLTLGYTVGAIGAWPAIAIWFFASLVALLQNRLFAEMAAMFPNRSGGISVYAYEGWKRHFAPLGAIAAFGYWMGWSLTLSITGVALGTLVQETYFPDSTAYFSVLGHELGLPHLIAIAAIAAAWALNYFGVKIAAKSAIIVGVLMIAGLTILIVGTFVSTKADFDASRLTAHSGLNWTTIVVWYYVTIWTVSGTEVCASFAAEYKDPVRDTSKALRNAALFIIGLYFIVPYVVTGLIGEEVIADNPIGYMRYAFEAVLGDYAWVGQIPVMAAFLIAMMAATADGGRSLYGIAREGGTIKQLGVLNRFGVPGRALTSDGAINIVILILLGEPVSILLASNLGYLAAVTLAIAAFVLLRRDQPHLHRPIKLGKPWIGIACALVVFNVFVIAVGVANPGTVAGAGFAETFAGLAILLIAALLYVYRQKVQDKEKIEWRIFDDEDGRDSAPEPLPGSRRDEVIVDRP